MVNAFVFPGQGSQAVGMGRDLAEAHRPAREVFDAVDEALGEKLSTTIFEGPEDRLTLTRNAQPAIMATSLAVLRVLEDEGMLVEDHCAFLAGHSLGEYSALAAGGSLQIEDCARLLQLRGKAMQQAVPLGEGAMAAILGLDIEAVTEIAEQASQGGVCEPANDNAPGQVVVSGDAEAVERAVDIAKARGARRAMMLNVSAPFHCRLMQPAADAMAEALANVSIKPPCRSIVSNVTARAIQEPSAIRQRLVEQVTSPVRWRESVSWMVESGVNRQIEIGPGKVLSGLSKRIAPHVATLSVSSPADVEALKKQFTTLE